MRIVLAITGASGVAYGTRLAEVLKGEKPDIVVSDAAKKIIGHEIGDAESVLSKLSKFGRLYSEHDIDAPMASGSHKVDAMVVCPCSMKTLSAIASGYAHNLICRAADVMIKEKRRLILVPRETPLSAIHIENMLKLSRLGVEIVPAMPGFYHKPKGVGDVVDFVVGKILDRLGITHGLYRKWGEQSESQEIYIRA